LKYYYELQYKRIHRSLKYLGVEPFIAYPTLMFLWYWVSTVFFDEVLYANYLYVLISAIVVYGVTNPEHTKFLKQHFSILKYQKVLIFNNVLKAIPFVLFLLYKTYFIEVFLIFALMLLLSFVEKRNTVSIIVPTPFGKKPSEFVIGFRKTFWLFIGAYGLAIIAVVKDNFNLGIFSMISIFLVCSSYYMKQDSEHKIVIAIRYSFMLTMPICIALCTFYIDQIDLVLLFLILGCMYLSMHILMKYAFQYEGVEVFQGIIGVLCFLFPPVLIIAIPYFYKKAIHNLDLLLK